MLEKVIIAIKEISYPSPLHALRSFLFKLDLASPLKAQKKNYLEKYPKYEPYYQTANDDSTLPVYQFI